MIPKAVERGKNTVLRCLYDLEGDVLYQIKWYKGQNEFFRFTPGEQPPEKVFALQGVNVIVRTPANNSIFTCTFP